MTHRVKKSFFLGRSVGSLRVNSSALAQAQRAECVQMCSIKVGWASRMPAYLEDELEPGPPRERLWVPDTVDDEFAELNREAGVEHGCEHGHIR